MKGILRWDIKQGSDAWVNIRAGKITSSVAKNLFAKARDKTQPFGAAAMTDAMTIAIERMTGKPAPTKQFFSKQTDRGNTLEPKAREYYELAKMAKVKEVGFIDCGKYGTSPDAVILPKGLCEIKSYSDAAKIMKAALGKNKEHDLQIKWHLFCGQDVEDADGNQYSFEWCDYTGYYPELPRACAINRYYQDSLQNKLFENALIRYEEVIEELIEKYKTSEAVF